MIIEVRGTSGSGKTTIVKGFLDRAKNVKEIFVPKRRKPLYYSCELYGKRTAVMGHYESACGGCDSIGSAPETYRAIESVKNKFDVVLSEGLLWSEDVIWTERFGKENVKVLFLTTSEEECIRRVYNRRKEAGKTGEFNAPKAVRRILTIERTRPRLLDLGFPCIRASSNQATSIIEKWIKDAKRTRLDRTS